MATGVEQISAGDDVARNMPTPTAASMTPLVNHRPRPVQEIQIDLNLPANASAMSSKPQTRQSRKNREQKTFCDTKSTQIGTRAFNKDLNMLYEERRMRARALREGRGGRTPAEPEASGEGSGSRQVTLADEEEGRKRKSVLSVNANRESVSPPYNDEAFRRTRDSAGDREIAEEHLRSILQHESELDQPAATLPYEEQHTSIGLLHQNQYSATQAVPTKLASFDRFKLFQKQVQMNVDKLMRGHGAGRFGTRYPGPRMPDFGQHRLAHRGAKPARSKFHSMQFKGGRAKQEAPQASQEAANPFINVQNVNPSIS